MDVIPEEGSYNGLFPLPSGSPYSAVGLRVGNNSLVVRGLQASGSWCRDLDRCFGGGVQGLLQLHKDGKPQLWKEWKSTSSSVVQQELD